MPFEKFLIPVVTTVIYGILAYWQPCLLTFCKTTSYPPWLNKIVYAIPIPFAEGVILSLILLLPLVIWSESFSVVTGTLVGISFVVMVAKFWKKVIPNPDLWKEPRYIWMNAGFDFVFCLVSVAIAAAILWLSYWAITKFFANPS